MSEESSNTPIYKTVSTNLDELAGILGNPIDLNGELHGIGNSFGIAYLESMVNESDLKANLLAPLLRNMPERNLSLEKIVAMLPETGMQILTDLETAASHLLEGRTIIFLNDETTALSFKTPGWAKHELKEPQAEPAIRGPREGFTETLAENIGIIRRWIADPCLRADRLQIGRRTKTNIAVMYLDDVAQPRLIKEVKKRISAIDIDGVIESGYIELSIKDRRATIFPLTQATERTDKATAAILEGRVAILVDKSPSVILIPVTVNEFYQSPDDYYIDFWLASFSRFIRMFGNILSVGLPGLYVAFAVANPELLPARLALIIAGSRAHNPFPLAVEVFMLEILVGIFYEAALRLPGSFGQTLGVASGVTLGVVMVFSGLASPITMIVVAITALATYSGPNYTTGLVWRALKYIMLLAASIFGFFGLTIAGVLILGHMADLKSFGVSYLAPWAPLQWPELKDTVIRAPFWSRWTRPKTYRPQDRLRSGGTKWEDDEDD